MLNRSDETRETGEAPAPRPAAARRLWLAALAVALAHLAVKAWHVGAASLWLDEAVAVHIAQRDALGIVHASRTDTTPPLYYLLLGATERLCGISEAAVRMPSVAASSATAAALFLLARRLFGSSGAWLASALFFLSDVNLRYAHEARPYALATLLSVLSFGLFLRALERPSRASWAAVAAVNALMVFTHYTTAFVLVAQGVALLWPWRGWTAARRFAATHVPVALALVGWTASLIAAGSQHGMDWMEPVGARRLNAVLNRLAGGRSGGIAFIVLATGAVAAFVLSRPRGERAGPGARTVAPLVLWALVPVAVSLLTSSFVRSLHARYLLYVSPALVLCWTAAALQLRHRWSRVLAAALALGVCATAFGRSHHAREADWRGVADLARSCPADRILVSPPWQDVPLAYAYAPAAFRDVAHTSARLAAEGVRAVPVDAPLAALDLATSREVLSIVAGPAPGRERLANELARAGFTPVARQLFPGVEVQRFVRDPATATPCTAIVSTD